MFSGSKPKQPRAASQTNGDTYGKLQSPFALLQLLICETAALFAAGIVIPSLFRSANHGLDAGGLHYFTIAQLTLSYKFQNLGFAVGGALLGAAIAYAISYPRTISGAAGIARRFRPTQWEHARKKNWEIFSGS